MARQTIELGAAASQTSEIVAMTRQTTELGAMARETTVKTLPRTVNVAGGRDEERQIEGEHRHYYKRSQHQNPPGGYHRGGGARAKGEKQTRDGKAAQPTDPRGGESA